LKIIYLRSKSQWDLYSKVSERCNDKRDYLRGFGYQGASRGLYKEVAELAFGGDFKDSMSLPSRYLGISGFGEMLPYVRTKLYRSFLKKTNGVNLLQLTAKSKKMKLK
jgi:hypothetical protein